VRNRFQAFAITKCNSHRYVSGGFDWEGGENRVVPLEAAGAGGGVLVVSGEFGGDVHVSHQHLTDGGGGGVAVPQQAPQQQQQHYDARPPPPPAASPSSREWQGGDVQWIRHRDQDAENRAMVGRCKLGNSVETHSSKAAGFHKPVPLNANPGFTKCASQMQLAPLRHGGRQKPLARRRQPPGGAPGAR
jgi:hypothetical protein